MGDRDIAKMEALIFGKTIREIIQLEHLEDEIEELTTLMKEAGIKIESLDWPWYSVMFRLERKVTLPEATPSLLRLFDKMVMILCLSDFGRRRFRNCVVKCHVTSPTLISCNFKSSGEILSMEAAKELIKPMTFFKGIMGGKIVGKLAGEVDPAVISIWSVDLQSFTSFFLEHDITLD